MINNPRWCKLLHHWNEHSKIHPFLSSSAAQALVDHNIWCSIPWDPSLSRWDCSQAADRTWRWTQNSMCAGPPDSTSIALHIVRSRRGVEIFGPWKTARCSQMLPDTANTFFCWSWFQFNTNETYHVYSFRAVHHFNILSAKRAIWRAVETSKCSIPQNWTPHMGVSQNLRNVWGWIPRQARLFSCYLRSSSCFGAQKMGHIMTHLFRGTCSRRTSSPLASELDFQSVSEERPHFQIGNWISHDQRFEHQEELKWCWTASQVARPFNYAGFRLQSGYPVTRRPLDTLCGQGNTRRFVSLANHTSTKRPSSFPCAAEIPADSEGWNGDEMGRFFDQQWTWWPTCLLFLVIP